MVTVNADRCCYCGGCVSVCPVDAICLAGTRLLVGEACIECGLCLPACPVGALREVGAEGPASVESRISRRYDLVVVGAGPGGSMAAWTAAELSLSVLLLEKRQEIGSPVRCAEGVPHESLAEFLEPDPTWIAAVVDRDGMARVDWAISWSGVSLIALWPSGQLGLGPRCGSRRPSSGCCARTVLCVA
jgi:ferredoxin